MSVDNPSTSKSIIVSLLYLKLVCRKSMIFQICRLYSWSCVWTVFWTMMGQLQSSMIIADILLCSCEHYVVNISPKTIPDAQKKDLNSSNPSSNSLKHKTIHQGTSSGDNRLIITGSVSRMTWYVLSHVFAYKKPHKPTGPPNPVTANGCSTICLITMAHCCGQKVQYK